jgi:hypothetical protein
MPGSPLLTADSSLNRCEIVRAAIDDCVITLKCCAGICEEISRQCSSPKKTD